MPSSHSAALCIRARILPGGQIYAVSARTTHRTSSRARLSHAARATMGATFWTVDLFDAVARIPPSTAPVHTATAVVRQRPATCVTVPPPPHRRRTTDDA